MIRVHRLDGKDYYLNANLHRKVEAVPDTLITLTTGRRLFVQESVAEVVRACHRLFRKGRQSEWDRGLIPRIEAEHRLWM